MESRYLSAEAIFSSLAEGGHGHSFQFSLPAVPVNENGRVFIFLRRSRPDMTFAVDWALKTGDLSTYPPQATVSVPVTLI